MSRTDDSHLILDDGRIVLVCQYRYPVRAVLLEVPAGKLDAGDSPLAFRRWRSGHWPLQWVPAL